MFTDVKLCIIEYFDLNHSLIYIYLNIDLQCFRFLYCVKMFSLKNNQLEMITTVNFIVYFQLFINDSRFYFCKLFQLVVLFCIKI